MAYKDPEAHSLSCRYRVILASAGRRPASIVTSALRHRVPIGSA